MKILEPLEHELLESQTDGADDGDASQHHVGVQELARAEDHPAQAPRHRRQHLHTDQDAPGLRQAEAQPGQDVWERAGQDHLVKQAPVIGPHGECRAHPYFLHRLHACPRVEDDGKGGDEPDQENRRDIAEAEPEQEKRRIGDTRDRRAHAHERQSQVLGEARPAHRDADGDAGDGGEREAGDQTQDRICGMVGKSTGDGEVHEGSGDGLERRKEARGKNLQVCDDLPKRKHHDERKSRPRNRAPAQSSLRVNSLHRESDLNATP